MYWFDPVAVFEAPFAVRISRKSCPTSSSYFLRNPVLLERGFERKKPTGKLAERGKSSPHKRHESKVPRASHLQDAPKHVL